MERNSSLDVIKFILCLFIIYIHCFVKEYIYTGADYILVIARTAVPLFFMISGYYYPTLLVNHKLKKYIKKILSITFFSTLFYAVVYFNDISFSVESLLNWVLYNDLSFAFHLWYLYALIYVLVIMYVLKTFLLKYAGIISVGLILINYFLSYHFSPLLYRNFLFTGLPYFLLGIWIAYNKDYILNLKIFKWRKNCITFLVLLLGLEYYLYKDLGLSPVREHYLFIYPLCFYIFCSAVISPNVNKNGIFSFLGNRYSTHIYIFHLFIISVIHQAVLLLCGEKYLVYVEHNYFSPFIIMACTCILIYLFTKMVSTVKRTFA